MNRPGTACDWPISAFRPDQRADIGDIVVVARSGCAQPWTGKPVKVALETKTLQLTDLPKE